MPRKKSTKPAAKKPTAKAAEVRDVRTDTLDLPIAAISPSPFQPRQDFAQEQIEQLAESIMTDGLIHPICVRTAAEGDGYELVDGERRLRACEWLGRETIRAELGSFTDAQVMRIVVASAIQRADLSPIEEGLAFKRAIEAGVAAGPTELARQLGVSQGHVSNRIRLLELPADVKAHVISGEIPPTHARCLLAYRDCPVILAEVLAAVCHEQDELYHCKCTVDTFEDAAGSIAYEHSRPLTGQWRSRATDWRDVPIFEPTEEQMAALQPIELGHHGKPEMRATNVDLWDKLQTEFLAARAAKAEKRERDEKPKAKELSAAEKKQHAAAERRKAKQRAVQHETRLREWYRDWLCYLVGSRLRADASVQELLVVACHCAELGANTRRPEMTPALKDACKTYAPEVDIPKRGGDDSLQLLVQLGEAEIEPVVGRALAEWFWSSADGPSREEDSEDLARLVTYLAIDRTNEWREDQAGPLSQAYWNLHSKEQLVGLAAELKVDVEPAAKKGDLVAAFMARNAPDIDPVALPAEIASLVAPHHQRHERESC